MLQAIKKVVFLGDGGVGKTSLIRRFLENKTSNEITVGVDFRYVKLNDTIVVLWDFSGQERFRALIENLVSGASLIVMVFDLSRSKTFFNLFKWAEIIQRYLGDVPVIIVGNKKDLDARLEENVLKDTLSQLPLRVVAYLETSAKTGENVSTLFSMISKFLRTKKVTAPIS
ncbi:MAG: Rab family GTPase [Candidatus Njordarchaeales archaeon]